VVWSDECSIERGTGVQPQWSFVQPGPDRLLPQHVQTRRCGKSVKKMFWAAFRYGARTGLVPLDGDELAPRNGVTARVYLEVLRAFLPTVVRNGDIFMQDGAGIHRAHIIRSFFHESGITVMVWPPYSPDLNPIENLWAILKVAIYERYPELEHAPDTVETLERLIDAAKECWREVEDRIVHNLSDTMTHRVQAVLRSGGWYTKY